MTVGEKVRRIRKFRGISLEEMGIAIGLEQKSAANRMTQYETNYRIPRKDVLHLMAKALNVNPINFVVEEAGTAEDIIQTLFWLEESSAGCIHLFKLEREPERTEDSKDTAARYADDDNWPAQPPVGLWFSYGNVDVLLREWLTRQEELSRSKITEEEYFEWKLNWPWTCDDGKTHEPRVQWRAKNTESQTAARDISPEGMSSLKKRHKHTPALSRLCGGCSSTEVGNICSEQKEKRLYGNKQ